MSSVTALDVAVKAVMREAGCRRTVIEGCMEHPSRHEWDDDRGECAVIGAAVRAGWNAAVQAAEETIEGIEGQNIEQNNALAIASAMVYRLLATENGETE